MSLATIDAQRVPVSRRSRSPKAPGRRVAESPKPRKVSFYLSAESLRRLGVTAVMEGTSQSAIVERLIGESLRRYVVSDRGKSEGQATVEESAGSGD